MEGDFEEGASISDGTTQNCGTLFGYISDTHLYGAAVRGTVDFGSPDTVSFRRGLVGASQSDSSLNMCRNLAAFPKGITRYIAGGIASCVYGNGLNAMKGDLVGSLKR